MRTDVLSTIDVFQAETATHYIRDSFETLREHYGQAYSLRAIAKRLDIPSVASLSMALAGTRRLSPELAERCADFLELKGPRRKFFRLLLEKERVLDARERDRIEEQCFFLRTVAQQRPMDWKQYVVLSNWYYAAIFVLVGLRGFVYDSARIAARLGRGLRAKQVEQAIQHLCDVGLLERRGDSLAQVEGPIVKTAEEVKSLSIQRYHREMLVLANAALVLPVVEREFSGLTFAVTRDRLPEIKDRIRQFRDDIDALSTNAGGEEVYQFSLQLFPLTRTKHDKGE